MKDDEKRFFRLCFEVGRKIHNGLDYPYSYVTPRNLIFILEQCGVINHKRAWYLLEKWSELGFYDYGVTLDLGWFEPDKLPERYKDLLKGE